MKKKIVSTVLIIIFFAGLILGINELSSKKDGEVKTFTAFFTTYGTELDQDNEIRELIAEKIGAKCEEEWLSGGSQEEKINSFIASGEYPDFISGEGALYEAGALIPIDEYWDDYPNIRNFLSDKEWEKFRREDGHIYWIPQFGVVAGEDIERIHEGEAFWIQTRVLKWAGYPKITTMDEYFDLLERYAEANPVNEDGSKVIPYTILCDDWRYFCLENVPQFLDGYPNDGCVCVDPVKKQVLDYNVSDTAVRYFKKLNEEYKKGIVDPESFTNTYEEYLNKLSSGQVLGMVDQWWDFAYFLSPFYSDGKYIENGYSYVPLPITIDKGITNQWHVARSTELDGSTGVGITVSCQDIPGAMKFLNDLLDEDIEKLRFWGVEGVDYSVDENGAFWLSEDQQIRFSSEEYGRARYCQYSYFPRYEGYFSDGINSIIPEYQESVFFNGLAEDVKDCFRAYNCSNYVDMLGSSSKPGVWYPMYSYSQTLTYNSESGKVWKDMNEIKHYWLPQVVMAEDFDSTWKEYIEAYNECHPEIFLEDIQAELERRISIYE